MANTSREAIRSRPSINFKMGFADGLGGEKYLCPSNGNPRAEDDYAIGWMAGDTARELRTQRAEQAAGA